MKIKPGTWRDRHLSKYPPKKCTECGERFYPDNKSDLWCLSCEEKVQHNLAAVEPLFEMPARTPEEQAQFDRIVAENALDAARAKQRDAWIIAKEKRLSQIAAAWGDDMIPEDARRMQELYEAECFPFTFVPPVIEPSQNTET